ncbi:MAG: DUF58 domain-containing protein [Planctomycetota bacterium]|nr:MAG: DUF58 domain-containing protein [Planctomycetota bacterium]
MNMSVVDVAPSAETPRKSRSWLVTLSVLLLGFTAVLVSSEALSLVFLMLIVSVGLLRVAAFGVRTGLRRNIIRRRKVRVTREAFWFFFIVAGFSLASINTGYNLLCLVTAMLLAFLLISGILAETTFRKLRVSRSLPQSVFVGEQFRVDVAVENQKRLIPSYAMCIIDVERTETFAKDRPYELLLKVDSGGKERVSYSARFRRRGRYVFNTCAVKSSFPFGLLEKTVQIPCRGEVTVYPRIRPIREPRVLGVASAEDLLKKAVRIEEAQEEFRGLREYRIGDNPRLIHWKTSARVRKLQVKEFERRRARRVLIILDSSTDESGAGGEGEENTEDGATTRFEWAVELAASLAGHFIRKGFGVAFSAMTPSVTRMEASTGRRRLYDILEKLARIGPSEEDSLSELAGGIRQSDLRSHIVILVSPHRPDEKAVRILQKGQSTLRVLTTRDEESAGSYFEDRGEGAL